MVDVPCCRCSVTGSLGIQVVKERMDGVQQSYMSVTVQKTRKEKEKKDGCCCAIKSRVGQGEKER